MQGTELDIGESRICRCKGLGCGVKGCRASMVGIQRCKTSGVGIHGLGNPKFKFRVSCLSGSRRLQVRR